MRAHFFLRALGKKCIRDWPHVFIGGTRTIGYVDHGKTTLTQANSEVLRINAVASVVSIIAIQFGVYEIMKGLMYGP